MKPRFDCPHARLNRDMVIDCAKRGELCAHQRWCMSKGWAVLTDQAGNCPARKDGSNERAYAAAANRSDAI